MRVVAVLFSFGILLALPPAALAQSGQVQGFGGITFGDVASSSTSVSYTHLTLPTILRV